MKQLKISMYYDKLLIDRNIKSLFILIYFISSLGYCSLMAQDNAKQAFPSVVPPSPDAAALGKYGEIPVGTYTGIPEINIPLYNIQFRKLSLPLSLSYHAGGVKVEDIASNIGLGWTLNAGGVITRTVQGLPDESPNGFFNNALPSNMANLSNASLKCISENRLDAQADDFYFNFGTYSGKLIFSKDGTCYSIPHLKIKIKPGVGPKNEGTSSWEITTDDGLKYSFETSETSTTQNVCAVGGGFPLGTSQCGAGLGPLVYTSTWYLTKIQAPQTDNFITISYLPTFFQMDVKGSTTRYMNSGANNSDYTNYCSTKINMNSKIINRIDFPGGKIIFTNDSRADLAGAARITSMTVFNYFDEPIRKYLFDNDQYFESGCSTALCKRLKLDGVSQVGKNNTQLPPHIFEYNSEILPARNSNDTDHWGYYNKRGNTVNYPEFIDYFNGQLNFDYLPGANKKPDMNAVKAGTLTKIIYPTGGYTTFDYELNEVVSNALPNKTSAKTKKRIDGTSSNPTQQSSAFTIQGYFQNGLYVTVRYQTTGCSTSTIPSLEANCPNLQIVGVNGTSYSGVFQSGLLKQIVIFLPNGQYKLTGANAGIGQSYFLEVEYEPELNTVNKFAGGLRVQRVTDSDAMDATKNVIRKYVYNDATGASTGRIVNYPVYHYEYIYNSGTTSGCSTIQSFVRSEQSNTTLGTSRGSYVGYGTVVELRGELGENGRSEYFYTSVWKSEQDNNNAFMDSYISGLPFGPPQMDNDWLRGYLIKKIDYRYQSGSYIKVSEIVNEYGILCSDTNSSGARVAFAYQTLCSGVEIRGTKVSVYKAENDCLGGDQVEYRTSLLRRYGDLSYVILNSSERTYNPDGLTYVENRMDFVYGVTHRQVTQVTKTLDSYSNSFMKQTTKYRYPEDYTFSVATDAMSIALNKMRTTAYIHNSVIEKQVWEQRNGITKLIDAELNLYKLNGYELDKQLKLVAATPLTSYVPANVNGSGNFIYQTTNFNTQISYDLFDTPTGNLIEATGIDGVKKSFLWGYQNLYPIAEAINAPSTAINYTSFEETSNNWVLLGGAIPITGDGITGTKYYVGQLESTSAMIAGTYTVSFWAKGLGNVTVNGVSLPINSTSWKEYATSVVLVTSSKININTNGIFIDEVRLHPFSAQLKTFTYDPLIGLKSISDAANLPVNYKYDDFNRLQSLWDSKGNLLKLFSYNLKGYTGPAVGSSLNPNFSFSGSQTSGGSISFTAENPDAGIQYDWDFGDGVASLNSTKNINHTYSVGGVYLVQLTVRKGALQNSSHQSIQVSIPTLPAPLVTINSTSYNISGLPLVPKLTVSASSVQSGGVTPYQSYVWQVLDQNGSFVPNQWTTTTPTATMTFDVPALINQNCAPTQYNYTVRCRVVDAANATSLWGSGIANYTFTRVLDVVPLSIAADYNETPSTVTVTNSDSNITVTSNVSWISVSSINQCGSFTLDFQLYTGTATSRVGTVTVSSSNGIKTVNVTQYKSGI